ncbi:MAG: Na+/H+ antiporter NhaC [Ostreibacterium sp.]
MLKPSYNPSFLHSALTFGAVIIIISGGLFYLKTSLHALMLTCLLVVNLSAWFLSKGEFKPIRKAMNAGISGAFSAIYIFLLIGVLIATFIQSGTIGALIYYGLQLISPAYFLPAGLILCSLMSIATGTSWGTVGTAGIVLIGIGSAMNLPLPLVAGMVISGACFGDKMSPVSDTTNLAAMSSGINLYKHIKSMSYTTGPTYLICLVLYTYLGLKYANHSLPEANLNQLKIAIESLYDINLLTLLPFIVMLVLSFGKVSAEPSMMASIVVAVLIALFMQDKSFSSVLTAIYSGEKPNSGIVSLDNLLGRGGIASMMWTLSLSLMALALGGVLHEFGFVRVLISGLLLSVRKAGSLVAITITSCFIGNLSMGEAYMSIILGGRLFGDAYDERGIDRSVMSRSLEEGATLTAALIPWTTGGAFFSSALGVKVIDYLPWALLNWINPLIGILFAFLGIAIFKKSVKTNAKNPI